MMTDHAETAAGTVPGTVPATAPRSDGLPPPPHVPNAPAKFLDPATGALRVDALMKSYMALERRLGAGAHLRHGEDETPAATGGGAGAPDGVSGRGRADIGGAADAAAGDPADASPDDSLHDPAGDPSDNAPDASLDDAADDPAGDAVPEHPDGYRIDSDHPWLGNDAELNGLLHASGFTQDQAQLVYDIAHEYVLPLLDRMAGEIAGLRGERQLREVFPGDDWEARAEQTRQWGASALPADLYGTLAATPAGVAAMHRMMQHGEPAFLSRTGPAGPAADEAELRRLMDDPRYWRDHDPAVIARVEDGFRRLYPD